MMTIPADVEQAPRLPCKDLDIRLLLFVTGCPESWLFAFHSAGASSPRGVRRRVSSSSSLAGLDKGMPS